MISYEYFISILHVTNHKRIQTHTHTCIHTYIGDTQTRMVGLFDINIFEFTTEIGWWECTLYIIHMLTTHAPQSQFNQISSIDHFNFWEWWSFDESNGIDAKPFLISRHIHTTYYWCTTCTSCLSYFVYIFFDFVLYFFASDYYFYFRNNKNSLACHKLNCNLHFLWSIISSVFVIASATKRLHCVHKNRFNSCKRTYTCSHLFGDTYMNPRNKTTAIRLPTGYGLVTVCTTILGYFDHTKFSYLGHNAQRYYPLVNFYRLAKPELCFFFICIFWHSMVIASD